MSDAASGGCLCGATTLSLTAGPTFAIRCFCRDCQHVTGGGGAPQVSFPADALTVTGPAKTYQTKADSGSDLSFVFCGDCGAPLTKATTRAPEMVFVYAGALDDGTEVPTLKHVFEASRPTWDLPS